MDGLLRSRKLARMRVLVVLPTYNESANIETVLRLTRQSLPDGGVLVVDDGSPDGTADIAERVGKEIGGIDVLRRTAKAGLGSAYRDGFRWGLEHHWDVLVEMDSDLSHDPAALPQVVGPLEDGFDLVVGSRYIPGGSIPNWQRSRFLLSRGGNAYAAIVLGLPVTDSTSGFRAYRAEMIRRLDLDRIKADGYGFQIEMCYQVITHGGRVTEVPIRFVDRVEGESKMSTHIVVEAFALVTWWGLQRLVAGLTGRGRGRGGRRRSVEARSDTR